MEQENQKALRYARINAWLTGALLAVVSVAAVLIVPSAVRTLDHAEQTLTQVEEELGRVDALIETADAALVSATTAADTASKLVAENEDTLTEAMEKINAVDFEKLNQAIRDLADIVEPLAKVSNFFNRG